jgi:DNA-directed RNA polymerase subunit RPC12/RpoP
MTERIEPTMEVVCLVCGRPMTFIRTISRPSVDDVNVFECKHCGFAITRSRTATIGQDDCSYPVRPLR